MCLSVYVLACVRVCMCWHVSECVCVGMCLSVYVLACMCWHACVGMHVFVHRYVLLISSPSISVGLSRSKSICHYSIMQIHTTMNV